MSSWPREKKKTLGPQAMTPGVVLRTVKNKNKNNPIDLEGPPGETDAQQALALQPPLMLGWTTSAATACKENPGSMAQHRRPPATQRPLTAKTSSPVHTPGDAQSHLSPVPPGTLQTLQLPRWEPCSEEEALVEVVSLKLASSGQMQS